MQEILLQSTLYNTFILSSNESKEEIYANFYNTICNKLEELQLTESQFIDLVINENIDYLIQNVSVWNILNFFGLKMDTLKAKSITEIYE